MSLASAVLVSSLLAPLPAARLLLRSALALAAVCEALCLALAALACALAGAACGMVRGLLSCASPPRERAYEARREGARPADGGAGEAPGAPAVGALRAVVRALADGDRRAAAAEVTSAAERAVREPTKVRRGARREGGA